VYAEGVAVTLALPAIVAKMASARPFGKRLQDSIAKPALVRAFE
jgi:hypothetical protein